MFRSIGRTFSLALVALTFSGCTHQTRTRTESSPVRETQSRAQRSAVRSIASARCEREERCGNIGVDAKFASKSVCIERVRADWSEELNARECPAGVRDVELDECIEDIRGEDCGSPFDSLQRMLSCGTAEICSASAS